MVHSGDLRLGRRLRARAERFFDADFGSVRVALSSAVRGGEARPEQVVLTPRVLGDPRGLRLLGHELAHVVQMRGHGPLARTPRLEVEAVAVGAAFARGGRARPRLCAARVGAYASLDVGGTHVDGIGGLTAAAQAVLALVPSGSGWVAWAAAQARRFSFEDEPSLVHEALVGLHDTPLLVLRRLGVAVSPFRLFQLPVATLQILARAESNDANEVVLVQARRLLAAEGLLGEDELRAVDAFLEEVGLRAAPVFTATTLGDRLALHQLLVDSKGEPALSLPLQREAAAYAVREALRAVDFVDRYRTYLVESVRSALLDAEPEARLRAVEEACAALRPHLFDTLFAATVRGSLPDAARIGRVVQELNAQGQELGFARLSAATGRVVEDAGFQRQSPDEAGTVVSTYRRRATEFFAGRPLLGPLVAQDGRRALYRAESENLEGELELDATGQLVLRRFRARRSEETAPARPQPKTPKPSARESRP